MGNRHNSESCTYCKPDNSTVFLQDMTPDKGLHIAMAFPHLDFNSPDEAHPVRVELQLSPGKLVLEGTLTTAHGPGEGKLGVPLEGAGGRF